MARKAQGFAPGPHEGRSPSNPILEVKGSGLAFGPRLGGCNFDARIRRQSIDPVDLVHAHVGAIDHCARAFLIAARMMEDGRLEQALRDRYAGWNTEAAPC